MYTLAIDLSTPTGSLALSRGEDVLCERAWEESRAANQRVFIELDAVLREAAVSASDLDLFAVSIGPGSFSGLRVALSAARALAMPGGKPVCGVSSGEVLARDLLAGGSGVVAVVGDARRGRLWLGQFALDAGRIVQRSAYQLVTPAELGGSLEPGATVVTSDWVRIGELLAGSVPPAVTLIREARRPSARTLGELARQRVACGETPGAPALIYLHPAVADRVPPVPPQTGRDGA